MGKFDRFDDNIMMMRTHNGDEVKIIKYKGEQSQMEKDMFYEIRGIVNKDNTISFGEVTKYDAEFDLNTYEQMLRYYHGMCKNLTLSK